jgi:uracil-DNA glycosylase family 4
MGTGPKALANLDILTELGLVPTWRLRARADAGSALESPAAPASPRASGAPEVAVMPVRLGGLPETVEARVARIALLEWRDFAADVDACVACGLAGTRKKSVPGVGDVHAEWLLVGEAPGSEEDAKGEPFVGQAGRLLDNMLAALGMKRGENVYIANVLKCRPPNNRTPEPREVDACRPYLDRQIALIGPKLILALGKSAATTLLGVDATIASLRGRVHRYQGVPLVVTYHPAYLLRNLPDKAKAWEDLLLARSTLQGVRIAADQERSDG